MLEHCSILGHELPDSTQIATKFDPEIPCEWDGDRLLIVVSGDWRSVLQWTGAEQLEPVEAPELEA